MNPWAGVVEALARALGWTLLHFCWQGIAVAAGLWYVLRLLGGRLSRTRYAATCVALLLMVALPVGTFQRLAQRELATRRALALPFVVIDTDVVTAAGSAAAVPIREQVKEALDRSAPWLPAVWLVGVLLFAVRLNLGLMVARRLQFMGTAPVADALQRTFDDLRERLGIARAVRLAHSALVQVPTVIGWLRPVLLLPVSCLTGLSEMQIEAILAHELAHVRRHDYLVSVLQSVVETLLFYHPAVWWVSRQVRRERECCCDQLAVEHGGDVLSYARALSWLEEQRAATPALVLGANGGVLKMRIKRLLGLREGPAVSLPAAIALTAVVLVGGVIYCGGVAQAEARLRLRHSAPVALENAEMNAEISAVAGPGRLRAFVDTGTAETREMKQLEAEIAHEKETLDFLRVQLDDADKGRGGTPGAGELREQYDQALAVYDRELTKLNQQQMMMARLVARAAEQQEGGPQINGGSSAMGRVYQTWLTQDVRWIITPQESAAFLQLKNDDERDHFIEQFWQRRNPNPDNPDNSYKDEIYRRIAYSNEHFGDGTRLAGWSTDRGHVYIAYGKPDSIDSHPGPNAYEVWHYKNIPGVGDNVDLKFVNASGAVGDYHYTSELATGGSVQKAGFTYLMPGIRGPSAAQVFAVPQAHAAQAQTAGAGAIEGMVADPTGALIQGAKVTAVNTDTGAQTVRQTDNSGKYSLSPVAAGPYNVEVQAPGFSRLLQENVIVKPSETAGLNLKLMVGGVDQTLTVTDTASAGATGPAGPPQVQGGRAAPTGPIPISPAVLTGMLVSKVDPVYPPIALAAHVQGVVVLHAVISKTGTVENVAVVNGRSMLTQSAIDAVKQWKYHPYLLNGEPVAVGAAINVNFSYGAMTNASLHAASGAPAAPPQGTPVRISSGVAAGLAISMPEPVYPAEAKAAHLQGVVTLAATISKTGDIEDLWVISGPKELVQSSIDAVTQWRYKPFLLNGQPTEVNTTIHVNYTFGDRTKAPSQSGPAPQAQWLGPASTIRAIDFEGLNSVTLAQVRARFKQDDVGLKLETPYDAAQLVRALTALRQMLAEHRRPSAVITIAPRRIPPAGVGILFLVKEGSKGTVAAKPVVTSAVEGRPFTVPSAPAATFRPVRIAFTGPQPDSAKWNGETIRKIGDGVTMPVVIYKVAPEYSAEARSARFMGVVLVNTIDDQAGVPQNAHIVRGVGMGLDEKALEAVRQYRFKPAMDNGKPVPVVLNVEINFQIFDHAPEVSSPSAAAVANPVRVATSENRAPRAVASFKPVGMSLPPARPDSQQTIRKIGGSVSAPMVMYQVEPEYSPEARAAKLSGLVTVHLVLDAQGDPQDVHMLHDDFVKTEKNVKAIASLDQEAVNAVRQYRFKPAMENGVAVPVDLNVEVNFQIF